MNQKTVEYGQKIRRVPSALEIEFMNEAAIPILDKTQNEESLQNLSEIFWNLCIWEKDRAEILDTKASYLLGLSSIAAAVITVGTIAQNFARSSILISIGISLGLFTITVVTSLITLLGKKYGAFNDLDIFSSLRAHINPIGQIKPFNDNDPRRCFLREITLQRWLIYKWHSDANDSKFKRLIVAQIAAVLSVISLFVCLLCVFIIK
ncbi:MAG: hypothetical protein AB1746_01760 [Candidatus Zixiibacteriota bacterium]